MMVVCSKSSERNRNISRYNNCEELVAHFCFRQKAATSIRCHRLTTAPHPNYDTMTKKSRARRPGSAPGPKKPSPQQIQSSRKSLRPKKGGANNEANKNSDEQLFSVEKIVDCKLDRNGVPTYKTRWTGYSASDDTWEPYENVVSTGHV